MPTQGSGGVTGFHRPVDYNASQQSPKSTPAGKVAAFRRLLVAISGTKSHRNHLQAKKAGQSEIPQKRHQDRAIKKHSPLQKFILKVIPSRKEPVSTPKEEPVYSTVPSGAERRAILLKPLEGNTPDFEQLITKLKDYGHSDSDIDTVRDLTKQLKQAANENNQLTPDTRNEIFAVLDDKRTSQKADALLEKAEQNDYTESQFLEEKQALLKLYKGGTQFKAKLEAKLEIAHQRLLDYQAQTNEPPPLPTRSYAPTSEGVITSLIANPEDLSALNEHLGAYDSSTESQQQVKNLVKAIKKNPDITDAGKSSAIMLGYERMAEQKFKVFLEEASTLSPQEQQEKAAFLVNKYRSISVLGPTLAKSLAPYLPSTQQTPPPVPKRKNSPQPARRYSPSQQLQSSPSLPPRSPALERNRAKARPTSPPLPPKSPGLARAKPKVSQSLAHRELTAGRNRLSPELKALLEEKDTSQPVRNHYNRLYAPKTGDFKVIEDPAFLKLSRYIREPAFRSPEATHAGQFGAHANYVLGNSHILAQGPSKKTIHSHLAMILQNNSTVSMDFTNNVDLGKGKTISYIPESGEGPMVFPGKDPGGRDAITVQTTAVKELPGGTKVYSVLLNDTPVTHIHNPIEDHSPGNPADMVQGALVSILLEANTEGAGPTVCHCSAGVGRSGTGVAIKAMVNHYLTTGETISVDQLDDMIANMRDDRSPKVVQTFGQYNTLLRVLENLPEYVEALRPGAERLAEDLTASQG